VMPPITETTALLLVPSGFVVLNKTLGSGDADGIRFSVLPGRAEARQAMVHFGRAFLEAYPEYGMTREYNAFFAEEQRSRAEMGARL
jgi:hypothetical protein